MLECDDKAISIWGFSVPLEWLSETESDYLSSLPEALPAVEWVWAEMDRVWHHYGLNNRKPLSGQPIGDFYSHPVWLMNGIFTALDPISAAHRNAIGRYVHSAGVRVVADYGGGFGELARVITCTDNNVSVSIVEPYPCRVGLERLRNELSIKFVPYLLPNAYDAIVAQDVLEHAEDPLKLALDIASAVREGGLIIFANCFYPVIQCHLPGTFHLRHTFPFVMRALGLRYIGVVDGVAHAQVFIRTGALDPAKARKAESLSKIFGPALNLARRALSWLKCLVVRK